MNKDSKIYIAGHKGLVGSALWNNLLSKGYNNLIGRSIEELDLMNQQAVADFFQKKNLNMLFLQLLRLEALLQITPIEGNLYTKIYKYRTM